MTTETTPAAPDPIAWSDPAGVILNLIKGDAVSKTISCVFTPASGAVTYEIVASTLPSSVLATVTAAGVVLSGDTSKFLLSSDILYLADGVYGQASDPDDVPKPSDVYEWLASPETDDTKSITIKASDGSASSERVFELFVANSWDAHKTALLALLVETA